MARSLSCASIPGGGLPEDNSGATCAWQTTAATDAEVLTQFRTHIEAEHRMAPLAGRTFDALEADAKTVIADRN